VSRTTYTGNSAAADRGLLSRDDLTLYGCAGLARAADRFDPDRGYKFSTYCYFWVRKAVLDGVKDCGRTIRLPKYLSEVLRETRKAERDLEAKLGRAPSDIELAEATKVDVTRVREWRNWAQAPLSLDAGAGGGAADADNGALVDGIAAGGSGSTSGVPTQSVRHTEDGPSASAEADADADLLRDALDEALATLLAPRAIRAKAPVRARLRVCARAGVRVHERRRAPGLAACVLRGRGGGDGAGGGQGRRVAPAARVPAGSLRETVRTIERRALAKLKQPSRLGAVLPHVDDETRARMEQSDEGGLFAAALAEAAEKADRRAGGGARLRGCRRSGPGERAPGSRRRREKKRARRGERRRAAAAATPAAPREESAEARERESGFPEERRGDGRDE